MNHYAEFLWQFLPLAAAHLVLPPLSYFRGERVRPEVVDEIFELIYSVVPPSILSERFINSLLRDHSHGTDLHHTMITHIFVHSSYEHLFGNLSGVLQFAYPVYNEFGTMGLYFLFLSGGAIASLPTFLRSGQKSAFSKLVYDSISIKPDSGTYSQYIPGGLRDIWNKSGASNVATILMGAIPTKVCGSSGACCALMGCDTMLLFRDCIITINNVFKSDNNGYDKIFNYQNMKATISKNAKIYRNGQGMIFNLEELTKFIDKKVKKLNDIIIKSDITIIYRLLKLYRGINYCYQELKSIYPVSYNSNKSSDENFYSKFYDLFFVGHAEHVQGFAYGASFAFLFGIIYPAIQRLRNEEE